MDLTHPYNRVQGRIVVLIGTALATAILPMVKPMYRAPADAGVEGTGSLTSQSKFSPL